jgi:methyl-accepting chemotaxis protein
MGRGFVRKRYIVDWNLQGSVIAHGLLYGGLVLVAIVVGIFLPLLWDLGDRGATVLDEQAIVMLWLHDRLWWIVAACAVIVAGSAVKLSHRIAGPLVRYKRNLRLLADGKLPAPLRTRRGDYLKQEVACLNAAVAGVGARVEAIRRAQVALHSAVLEVAARPVAGSDRAGLDRLAACSHELARAVAAFAPFDPGDERGAEATTTARVVLAVDGAEGAGS